MAEFPDTVDDAISLLGVSPSTDEVLHGTIDFQARELAAAAVAGGGGGGGGSQPVTREQFAQGPSTTCAGGGNLEIEFGAKFSGSDLVDMTDPAHPLIVDAGVYAVMVNLQPAEDLTVGKGYRGALNLDATNDDCFVDQDSAPARTGMLRPWMGLTLVYYIPAGGMIYVNIYNYDTVDRTFFVGISFIQRLA